MRALLDTLAPYHDYGWFLALLAWSAVGVVWHYSLRAQREWGWLPWAAASGVIVALIELVSYSWPERPLINRPDHLVQDFSQGFVTAIAVAGCAGKLPVRRGLRMILGVVILAGAGLRLTLPEDGKILGLWANPLFVGSLVVAVAGTLIAVVLGGAAGAPRRMRIALTATVGALWLASAGPLASSGLQVRAWIGLGGWSAVWSAAQAAAAIVALAAVAAAWFGREHSKQEWRPLLVACGIWILSGLGAAALLSAWSRDHFETQALGRAQATANLVNRASFAQLLDERFVLTNIRQIPRPSGGVKWVARVDRLTDQAVPSQLTVIEKSAPENVAAYCQTMREGRLVIFSSNREMMRNGRMMRPRPEIVTLGEPSDYDWSDWAARAGRFLPLVLSWTNPAGAGVHVRAPLVSEEGQMLGWLVLNFRLADWLTAQVQPRLQTYLIVALGLGLAAMVAAQRVRTRERENARNAAAAAAQADQLKTAFLAKVSHELRTPIQSVLGYGELLRHAVHDPLAMARLAALRQHGELMLRLVNDLLDLSAMQAGSFRLVKKPVALPEIVRQTAESLRPRAEGKGLALAVEIDSAVPPWVELDGERLRQIILNLLGNAIKFTDQGRVSVELSVGPQGGDELVLTVCDTGPGISPSDRERLFHPFERLEATAAKEGTGLGLSLTVALCRGMGGGIAVESSPGAGATFRASFRAARCPAPAGVGEVRAERGLSGQTVLVADDNQLVRELFVAGLQEAGAQCVAVADGAEALLVAENTKLDAIVLDLAMPRMGGLETARQLRERRIGARILGVSAHAGEQERERALAVGMDAFLVKPVALEALVGTLAELLLGRRIAAGKGPDIRERLRLQFYATAATERALLAESVERRDFAAVRSRAHHLMNSAAVVADDRLFVACVHLEGVAVAVDARELDAAWRRCEEALTPWLRGTMESTATRLPFVQSTHQPINPAI